MRYAIVDGERAEAKPRLRGACQCCGGQTISKCGEHVVWHWAHRRREDCDPWWESETEWHRSWKDRFPPDWQEVVHCDPATREKHIADVKTPHSLVIEIQNSPIHPEEMRSREKFYESIVWIVIGDRREPDRQQSTLDLTVHDVLYVLPYDLLPMSSGLEPLERPAAPTLSPSAASGSSLPPISETPTPDSPTGPPPGASPLGASAGDSPSTRWSRWW